MSFCDVCEKQVKKTKKIGQVNVCVECLKTNKGHLPTGTHLIIEYFGCDFNLINNEKDLLRFAIEATKIAGCDVVKYSSHKFKPFGVTAFVLLAESHLSLHTYPEFGYVAIDIFTCGEDADPYKAHIFLKEKLKPININIDELTRGVR